MFEKGPHVSFSNCSLPFYLCGVVESSDKLVLMDPVAFKKKYNIEARVQSEVLSINRNVKTVLVKNILTDETYEENYDHLVLSPGASPIVPNLPGVDSPHVFTVRNVQDIERLNNCIQTKDIQNIAVVGGGFIGVEVIVDDGLTKSNSLM